MKRPSISVIVPVYNMERYLAQCLESIAAQTFTDWECIVVNDGSTDRSASIIDTFARRDPRFRVIVKPNGGLSSSRNAALRAAAGDYVAFVDSDDWIEPRMLEHMHRVAEESGADIVQVGFFREYVGRRCAARTSGPARVIDGKTAMREMGFDKMPNYVWNKLHRREIIDCEFPDGRNFEDIYVYGRWLRNVRRMALDPTPLYHYRIRRSGICQSGTASNRHDYFRSCIDRMHMMAESGISDDDRRNAYLNKVAARTCKMIARSEKDTLRRTEAIRRISREIKTCPPPSIRIMTPRQWCRATLLRQWPGMFAGIMRAEKIFSLHGRRRARRMFD